MKPQLLGVLAVLNRKFIAARKYNSEEQITSVCSLCMQASFLPSILFAC